MLSKKQEILCVSGASLVVGLTGLFYLAVSHDRDLNADRKKAVCKDFQAQVSSYLPNDAIGAKDFVETKTSGQAFVGTPYVYDGKTDTPFRRPALMYIVPAYDLDSSLSTTMNSVVLQKIAAGKCSGTHLISGEQYSKLTSDF